jgi:6-phosphogluconolactonase (cycloisomerase 2 family)
VDEDASDSVINLRDSFADTEDTDDALTYTIVANTNPDLFANTIIDGSDNLTLDYAANQNGVATITIRATDTGGKSVETSFDVTVNAVIPVNATPTTAGIADVTVDEDASDSVINLFTAFDDIEDADTDLIYTIENNDNAGLFAATTIDAATGNLTLDYAANQNGVANITIRATDTGGKSVETSFAVTVNAVIPFNATPTTAGIADVTVNEDASDSVIDLWAAFDDVEDDDADLIYTIEANTDPALFTTTTIDDGSGNLTLDYAANQNGVATITIRATDTGDKWVETSFAVTVNAVIPVNAAPTTSTVTLSAIAEDSGVRLITQAELLANAADSEGDGLTASNLTLNTGSGVLIDNGDGSWNFTPTANDDTSVSFSYTISDATNSVAGSATLDITPLNDAPTTSTVTLAAIAEDSGVRLITQAELLSNAADSEGDGLTASNLSISAGSGTLDNNGDGTWNGEFQLYDQRRNRQRGR